MALTELITNLPYVRTFPRWLPPPAARGTLVPMRDTAKAEAAMKSRLSGQTTAKIEEEIALDPDVAIEIATLKQILNPSKLQAAILQKPLLALSLAKKAPWANRTECARNIGTLPELAWQFHYCNPDIDVAPNVKTIEEDAHYTWRALTELNLPEKTAARYREVIQSHPFYRILSLPTPTERLQSCKINKERSQAEFYVYLLATAEAGQAKTDEVEYVLRRVHKAGVALTTQEKETLAFLLSHPNLNPPGDENYISALAVELFANDAQWLHHLAKHRRHDGHVFMDALIRMDNTLGWILQTLWDEPGLLSPAVQNAIEQKTKTPEQRRDLIRWGARFTTRPDVIENREAA